jgi:cytochrome c oxidase subunit 2
VLRSKLFGLGFLSLLFANAASAASSVFMPPDATAIATEYDKIYSFLIIVSVISFVLLIGGMIWFVFKYRRQSEAQKSAYITHSHVLEFLWSFIPFVIFMFVFVWGWMVYHEMRNFPEDALEVHVVAKQWDWKFIYKNGREVYSSLDSSNNTIPATMVVPLGRPVKLIMASQKKNPDNSNDPSDRAVIHSFFVPAFRIKQDVVPGRYSAIWFKAEKLGTYNIFCAEYCGTSHSRMRGLIKVVTPEEFDAWLATEEGGALSLAEQGKKLYQQKACAGCHSLDGSRIVGPTFKGLWGREEEIEGGAKIKVDEDYIRESILAPNAKIVDSYPANTMPVFAGQVTDDEIRAIIEFIKTVK